MPVRLTGAVTMTCFTLINTTPRTTLSAAFAGASCRARRNERWEMEAGPLRRWTSVCSVPMWSSFNYGFFHLSRNHSSSISSQQVVICKTRRLQKSKQQKKTPTHTKWKACDCFRPWFIPLGKYEKWYKCFIFQYLRVNAQSASASDNMTLTQYWISIISVVTAGQRQNMVDYGSSVTLHVT